MFLYLQNIICLKHNFYFQVPQNGKPVENGETTYEVQIVSIVEIHYMYFLFVILFLKLSVKVLSKVYVYVLSPLIFFISRQVFSVCRSFSHFF